MLGGLNDFADFAVLEEVAEFGNGLVLDEARRALRLVAVVAVVAAHGGLADEEGGETVVLVVLGVEGAVGWLVAVVADAFDFEVLELEVALEALVAVELGEGLDLLVVVATDLLEGVVFGGLEVLGDGLLAATEELLLIHLAALEFVEGGDDFVG